MSWGSAGEFFAMGGYGLYVWGSYGVFFGLIAAEAAMLVIRRRNIVNQIGLIARERRSRKPGAA
jgi:heme exporter protein D